MAIHTLHYLERGGLIAGAHTNSDPRAKASRADLVNRRNSTAFLKIGERGEIGEAQRAGEIHLPNANLRAAANPADNIRPCQPVAGTQVQSVASRRTDRVEAWYSTDLLDVLNRLRSLQHDADKDVLVSLREVLW